MATNRVPKLITAERLAREISRAMRELERPSSIGRVLRYPALPGMLAELRDPNVPITRKQEIADEWTAECRKFRYRGRIEAWLLLRPVPYQVITELERDGLIAQRVLPRKLPRKLPRTQIRSQADRPFLLRFREKWVCSWRGHAFLPLEYIRDQVIITPSNRTAEIKHQPGEPYIGCARCLSELPSVE